MSSSQLEGEGVEIDLNAQTLKQIRERTLAAEKNKLNLDNPRGIINEIEDIIRAEIK